MARAIAASLAPPRASDPPPPWLDPVQADSFRLLLHLLRADRVALCAEPTGSGKTFIALAVARTLGAGSVVCLVPATLVNQWKATADRLGVEASVWSHSLLSRGRLPPCDPALVIVDESHHFRNPGIRRYRTLAPWLAGRGLLLLSATPVVNRAADLYHQLHLGLRDSGLAGHGVPSLRAAFARGEVPPAVGRFVIQRAEAICAPGVRTQRLAAATGAVSFLPDLDRLLLSAHPPIAALVRSVLVGSAASSARALAGTLRRYRHLLLHARDARADGLPVDRRQLRRLVRGPAEQLQFWSLLPVEDAPCELAFEDLPVLDSLLARLRAVWGEPDEKSRALEAILSDRLPTLVFVTARETIPFLRGVLPDPWLAWCTGGQAGIGTTSLPRHAVLRWFRPGEREAAVASPGQPRTLLTTDVAAEGLDLQDAGRVVHYDLPWTDVRIRQRNGRAVRRGSHRREVEVVHFLPVAGVERRLRQLELLHGKALLPASQGIGSQGLWRWRWRGEIADRLAGPAVNGVAIVRSDSPGALAGIVLERGGAVTDSTILCLGAEGRWSADPVEATRRLEEAERGDSLGAPDPRTVRLLLAGLSPSIRTLLGASSEARVSGLPPSPGTLLLGRRLRALAVTAARERDASRLDALDRALRFCNGGHTAGEQLLIDALASAEDAELLAALPTLPEPSPIPSPIRPRLTGLLLFQAAAACARRAGT